jgi:hypothetical protein
MVAFMTQNGVDVWKGLFCARYRVEVVGLKVNQFTVQRWTETLETGGVARARSVVQSDLF